jgi:hypothetical protein
LAARCKWKTVREIFQKKPPTKRCDAKGEFNLKEMGALGRCAKDVIASEIEME